MAEKKKETKKSIVNTLPFYVALVVLFALFIIYQGSKTLSAIFGIALFILIVVLIVLEIMNGIKEEGFKKNIIEIAAAIIIVVVFWFGLKAVLRTNYPLDVVPSCSMLPNLQRGDMIVLHGITNATQLKVPIVKVSPAAFANFQSNIQNEFLSCVSYADINGRGYVSQIQKPGYSIGFFKGSSAGGAIVPDSSQGGNLVKYTCGTTNVKFDNGTIEKEAYLTSVSINGTVINNDINNSIVVYQTVPQDYFYQLGDSYIVHRAYAVIDVNGTYYVLTKGDNNPGLDLQYGNYPSNLTTLQGKVVASIPYLGFLKLALSNSFVEPAGCNSTVINN